MKSVAVKEKEQSNEVALYDPQLLATLKSSLFPGAKDESVLMAIEYCRHAKLDIMLKPVHLVPMWIVDKETGKGEMRDVVMPGINLYRIQASRSGCAGISEPEFGEDVSECLGGVDITYPKWCRVTVKRIVAGKVAEYTAKELWKENYATAGKDKQTGKISMAPNAMWKKRPYAQLAKCAEAQALRKAFPEIGAMPTAEEMEGKQLDSDELEEMQKQKPVAAKGVQALKAKLGMVKDEQSTSFDQDTGEVFEGEVIDGDIGEGSEPDISDSKPTLTDVLSIISKATSIDELVVAADVARELPEDLRAKARKAYREKEALLSI